MTQRACRACGCTEHNACTNHIDGPCWWVSDDLCSHCQLAAAALGSKITVANDLGNELVTIEMRHALQLQKMTTWLLGLPTSDTIDQIYAGVIALQAMVDQRSIVTGTAPNMPDPVT